MCMLSMGHSYIVYVQHFFSVDCMSFGFLFIIPKACSCMLFCVVTPLYHDQLMFVIFWSDAYSAPVSGSKQ